MPYLLKRFFLALFCFCTLPGWAADALPLGSLLLDEGTPSFEVSTDTLAWLDKDSRMDINRVAVQSKMFTPVAALQMHPLTRQDTLWIKLPLVRTVGSTPYWTLSVPLPYLDLVTLYQRSSDGQEWVEQAAGDTLAQTQWNKAGIYPDFQLKVPSDSTQDVYLRIRNYKHSSIPIRLTTTQARESQRLLEMTLWGLIVGALTVLALLSLLRYKEHGNRTDLLACAYGGLVMLTVAQTNGILNALLWTRLPGVADYAFEIIPVVAISTGLLFLRRLYSLSTHYLRYDIFLERCAWLCIASILSYLVVDRLVADRIGSLVIVFAGTLGLSGTLLSWRGNSSIWRWLMLAYVPQYLGLMRLMIEALGFADTLWQMRYATTLLAALSVPVLVYALSRITHDRKELASRANLLPTQDALTGLLTPQAFQAQLEQAYERVMGGREPIALVLVNVVNHEPIRLGLGDAVAEQCLLRAVVKLHRILRDVDPAGRVETSQFALLLQGVSTRQALTERMVQLIASGLIPLPGLTPPVTLQFQAACVLLHENPIPPEVALPKLAEVLAGMSPQSRRPIRFLEADATQVVDYAGQAQGESQTGVSL